MTTVHDSPDYKISIPVPPPADYPLERKLDTYSVSPFLASYEERRGAFLEHCRANPAPNNTKAGYYELARLYAGDRPHEGVFLGVLDYIDQRKDCSDFAIHSILRLLYQFGEMYGLGVDLSARARETVLGFKYWPDEPGIDDLCTWTENHQILFASAAFLAGQLFPDQVFTNSGQLGHHKMTLNKPRILHWLSMRFRTGFSEWLSHVYYDEDMTALLSLIDFCQDPEIVQKSKMVLDLMLLDLALNSYKGVFGSTHGRSYENSKKYASNEGTTDTSKLLFGMGGFSAFDNMSAVNFAISPNYRMPPVLYEITNDQDQPEMVNTQRMGIRVSDAERWDLDFKDYEDGMVLLSLEAYAHPDVINLFMQMMDKHNWWENRFLSPFKPYRRMLKALQKIGALPLLAKSIEYDVCRNTREEVNLYTYRTPDYMLSCAQDYRRGYGGDQQHIWQATLGPNAVCFTTHPSRRGKGTPDYWTGSGTLPRAAQVKNVVIAIYKITRRPALYVPNQDFFTHAWVPRDFFDEVVEREGWIFARKNDGYLALRSQHPYSWQEGKGEDYQREIIVMSPNNVWLCELGRRLDNGDFQNFIEQICESRVDFSHLHVIYHSPSQGKLSFGWDGDLRQNGNIIPLANYPRYSNLYTVTGFPSDEITVNADTGYLSLNWLNLTRNMGVTGEIA